MTNTIKTATYAMHHDRFMGVTAVERAADGFTTPWHTGREAKAHFTMASKLLLVDDDRFNSYCANMIGEQ